MKNLLIHSVYNLGEVIAILMLLVLSMLFATVAVSLLVYGDNIIIASALALIFSAFSFFTGFCSKDLIFDFIQDSKEEE